MRNKKIHRSWFLKSGVDDAIKAELGLRIAICFPITSAKHIDFSCALKKDYLEVNASRKMKPV